MVSRREFGKSLVVAGAASSTVWTLSPSAAASAGPRPSVGSQLSGTPEVYNVKTFGAVGDGETDDATAVQAAIDAAASGGTVYFPAGLYRLEHTLYYRSGIRLLGDYGATLLQATGILFDRASRFAGDVCFDNLTITRKDAVPDDYVNRSGQGSSVMAIKGYFSPPVSDITVRNCVFRDIAGYALFLKGINNLRIQSCRFENIYDAVECGSSGDSSNYESHAISHQRLTDNMFRNVSTGVVIQGLSDTRLGQYKPSGWIEDVLVSGNYFRRVVFIGVQCYAFNNRVDMHSNVFKDSPAASLAAKLARNIRIHHNIAPHIIVQGEASPDYDFELDQISIHDNLIEGQAHLAAKTGILIWRQASNVMIRHNEVKGHQVGLGVGMTSRERELWPAERQESMHVIGNVCHDNTRWGISSQHIDRLYLIDNHCYDNGDTASDQGTGHRAGAPMSNSMLHRNRYDETRYGSARKQAIGLYFEAAAVDSTTEVVDIFAHNNKKQDIYNPGKQPIRYSVLQAGKSAERPAGAVAGMTYFDTRLGVPIWYNGKRWVDANGRSL